MSDPVEFLKTRLDATEALASNAESLAKSPWRADGGRIEHSGYVDPEEWYADRKRFLWDSEGRTADGDRTCMRHDVARLVTAFDPAMVLQLVAATRQLLELHERWELPKLDYVGNNDWRQVGVRYECWHCINSDESHMDWPCPTLRAVAVGWGWTDEGV